MNALLTFNDRHPNLTGVLGSISGLSTWLFGHIDGITSVAACIGTVATAGIALLTFCVKIFALIRRHRKERFYLRRLEARELDGDDDLPWNER